MLEIVVMIAIPIILSIAAAVYINFGEIKSKSGFSQKLKETFRINKNKIVIIISLIYSVGFMFLSHWFYEERLEVSCKLLLVYNIVLCAGYVDLKKRIIPNKLMIFAFFSYFVFFAYEAIVLDADIKTLLLSAAKGLLLGGGVFALCGLLSKGSMGMGDIKLFSVLGILLGWRGVFNVIFFSVVAVTVYAVAQLIRNKITRKTTIPVGPFALIGLVAAMSMGIGGLI